MAKTKNIKTKSEKIGEVAQQVGLVLMTAAATVGMLEIGDHPNKPIVMPNQPALALATNNTVSQDNPLRREREETAPHYISYSVIQRTPGRTGKA